MWLFLAYLVYLVVLQNNTISCTCLSLQPMYTLPKFGSVNGRSVNRYYGTSKSSTIWLPNRK
jgi:hypothetical protein